MNRVYNFSAGPATLPLAVLEEVQAELLDYRNQGMSILEMSHRSKAYEEVNSETEARFKRLVGAGDGYRVLFMQGGASSQFALAPLNFLPDGGSADYVLTGVWSEKAVEEANLVGTARVAASSKEEGYRRVPPQAEWSLDPEAAYVHVTSNNTIYGTQMHEWPDTGSVPLVADMSSDIFSAPSMPAALRSSMRAHKRTLARQG